MINEADEASGSDSHGSTGGDPNGADGDAVEQVTRPLGKVVRDVGLAVAAGQRELDDALLREYRAQAAKTGLDLETPWYRFAEVEVDLELFFHTVEDSSPPPPDTPTKVLDLDADGGEPSEYTLMAGPATPSDATFSETERSGASRIRFRIVPVAPPVLSQGEGRVDGR